MNEYLRGITLGPYRVSQGVYATHPITLAAFNKLLISLIFIVVLAPLVTGQGIDSM